MSNRTEYEIAKAKAEAEAEEIIQQLLDSGMTMQQIWSEIKKIMENKNEMLHMRKDDSQPSRDGSLS